LGARHRIRRSGGPIDLLDGYDPIVRNALSHTGSDGVLYDPGSIVFRSIRRGSPPIVQARRWSHEELHDHVIALIELIMSVDAAVEIFGIDNVEAMHEGEVHDRFAFHALDSEQRRALSASAGEELVRIRRTETIPLSERFELLGRILFQQCAQRNIACRALSFNEEQNICIVSVPVKAPPVSDDEIREQVMLLIRYLILARSVFGDMFERFVVHGEAEGTTVITVYLKAGQLDEYIVEKAGLIDFIGNAEIWFDGGPLTLTPDFATVAAAEDTMLGPRLPRRRPK
jgi:hypothetical protein